MKKKVLIDAINLIDDDLIAEASKAKKKKKPIWIKVTSIAACMAVLVSAIAVLPNMINTSKNISAIVGDTQYEQFAVATAKYPESCKFKDYDAMQKNRDINPVSDEFYRSIENFSYKTASQLIPSQDKNMLYSPISLYYALSLATSGANGETQKELLDLLETTDIETLSNQSGNLYRLLYTDNEISQLRIANSLWLDKKMEFKNDYLSNAVNNFYSSLFSVDFSDQNTSLAMNKWVSENTNGTLERAAKPTNNQIMSILNTIYFYDQWIDRFDASKTKKDTFTLSNGSKVKCDFMNSEYFSHGFSKGDGFTRSSLGLKTAGEMVFILPDEGVSVEDLLSSPEKIKEIFNGGEDNCGEVVWKIPKFSYGTSLDINDAMKALGVSKAFDKSADFSGITDNTAFISNITQNTHIAIDENGVEASAFTEISMDGAAMPTGRAEMILDRPFVYGITSQTGNLLFIGVCNNPTN